VRARCATTLGRSPRRSRARREVRSAALNYVRTAEAVPTDEFYPFQWHYGQINLPQAWDVVAPNSGVIVACSTPA
jgi:serine protease